MCPCPVSTTAGRSVLACSRRRRGRRRGGAGRAGPTGPRGHCGGERVRRATVEQDQRREGAAAVAVGMRSPYLDRPRRWRRGAVDGEVTPGRLR
jgi:hypothetical protein